VLRLIARGTELKEGFKTLGELKFGHEDTVHFTFNKNRDGGGGKRPISCGGAIGVLLS